MPTPAEFFAAARSRARAAWAGIGRETINILDRQVLLDQLREMIAIHPVTIRIDDHELQASLDDGRSSDPLESGGFMPAGTIQLYLVRDDVWDAISRIPEEHDEVELLQGGEWKIWVIDEVGEAFDELDSALTLTLRRENV